MMICKHHTLCNSHDLTQVKHLMIIFATIRCSYACMPCFLGRELQRISAWWFMPLYNQLMSANMLYIAPNSAKSLALTFAGPCKSQLFVSDQCCIAQKQTQTLGVSSIITIENHVMISRPPDVTHRRKTYFESPTRQHKLDGIPCWLAGLTQILQGFSRKRNSLLWNSVPLRLNVNDCRSPKTTGDSAAWILQTSLPPKKGWSWTNLRSISLHHAGWLSCFQPWHDAR